MIENLQSLIEEVIAKHPFGSRPKSLYEPIRYIMALGGKRLRPMLTLLSYSMFKSNVKDILPYALAVEAFHNFSLMHDDIMDGAPLRRGKATVHKKWNTSTAILSGDVMLVKVYDLFLGLPEKKFKEVVTFFNACAAGVCEGQQMDMEFEEKKTVTESEYLEMIRLKTAVLIGFSLELGGALADASEKERQLLKDSGINLGIGFQLMDDILDVYGKKKEFGKQVGGDIIANKKTFLLIKALENAKGKDRKELDKWLSAKKFDKRKKVSAVKNLYDKLSIRELSEQKAAAYFEKAYRSLREIDGERKDLMAFVGRLADRKK